MLERSGVGESPSVLVPKEVDKKNSPDFIFLSETKLSGGKAAKVRDNMLDYEVFWVDSVGCSGGLMMFWKKDVKVTVLSYSIGHIDVRIQLEDGFLWRFQGCMVIMWPVRE